MDDIEISGRKFGPDHPPLREIAEIGIESTFGLMSQQSKNVGTSGEIMFLCECIKHQIRIVCRH